MILLSKLIGDVPMVYRTGATATAIVYASVASAVVGAGSAAYQAEEQKKAAGEDERKRMAEAEKEQLRVKQIAEDTRPDEKAATGVEFGSGASGSVGGSTSDFVVPKTSSLTSSGSSGLGFVV